MQKISVNRFRRYQHKLLKNQEHDQINQNYQYGQKQNRINIQKQKRQVSIFGQQQQKNQTNKSQFNRKSQAVFDKNSFILKNIIESNQKKRLQLLNNLIKKNHNHNYHDQNKFKIKFQYHNKQQYLNNSYKYKAKTEGNQPSESINSARSRRNQININKNQLILTERKRQTPKVSIKQAQYLRKSFNQRIKQIKMRKYYQKDEIQMPTHLFQAYGSSIIGSKHQQNQDAIYFSQGIYVLCDGHGSNGKQISNFISQAIHNSLNQCLQQRKIDETIILQTYKKIDLELQNSNFDISFSGCTCVTLFRHDNTLYCISLGDSRAIISRGYTVNQISITHKPNKPQQKQRIQNYGGIVRQTQVSRDKFVGPMRIWAPGKNSWGPGLALSRAFGDKASRRYGVIPIPQITKITLNSQQQFIVIGSDGLFDFFPDQDIHQFVRKQIKQDVPKCEIPHELVKQAKKKWLQDSDDISCIIIFM